MNAALKLGYELAAQILRAGSAALRVAPAPNGKVARALRARGGIRERYSRWGVAHRDGNRPLLWMHAPSVGEGLQARPVLELMRARHPGVQLAYTFFSPSAETFARSLAVDFTDYLPFDSAADARAAVDALRPSALVFAKLDVWPTLCDVAHRRGVKLGMISATLAESSSRRGGFAGALLRDAYALLDAVGAIDPDDAERLVALGVRRDRISITGDTRYDQVWERSARVERTSALLAPLRSERPTLVAGSTWPADEGVLLPALAELRTLVPALRIIVAPHEPTREHLAPIERWASDQRLRIDRLAAARDDTDLVLVDRVGVLGDLYALADVAFVGGGFHGAGLHSVLEPAAFGVPVLFGPGFGASRDARLLIERGGAAAVSDAAVLRDALARWLGDPAVRRRAGDAARALVRDGLGAAERSLAVVEGLLSR